MKKHLLILVMSISTLVIFSCKKSNVEHKTTGADSTLVSSPLLTKWEATEILRDGTTISTTLNYYYDSNRRLITVTGVGGEQNIYTGAANYTYSGNTISLSSNLNYQNQVNQTFTLDESGKAIKLSDNSNNYALFSYTSDGYLSEAKIYLSNRLDNSTQCQYSNGNLIATIKSSYDGQGKVFSVETNNYTYYTDKPAISNADFALNAVLFGKPNLVPIEYSSNLLGKQSKNLVKSCVGNYDFNYTFANNTPVQITDITGNVVINLTYGK